MKDKICQEPKGRIGIEEKDKLSDFLWKEKDLKIKQRLSSLNLIANYGMNVKNVSSALGISVQTIHNGLRFGIKEVMKE